MSNETCADRKTLTVHIPATPDPVLNPNRKVHWAIKNRARDVLKDAVFFPTFSAVSGWRKPVPLPVTLNWTIYWGRGRRKQDVDNVIASLKGAQDSVATALCLDDKHFRIGSVEQARDKEGRGYMELTITAGADA